MPYEPIRCPTCGSTKTIAAENKRFFCASCDGWFVWSDATHAEETEPAHHQTIDAMQKELRDLRELVKTNAAPPNPLTQIPARQPEKIDETVSSAPEKSITTATSTRPQKEVPQAKQTNGEWGLALIGLTLTILIITFVAVSLESKDGRPGNASTSRANENHSRALRSLDKCFELHKQGKIDEAIDEVTLGMTFERNPGLYFYRGSLWQEKKEFDKSISDFTNAISMRDDFALAFASRASARLNKTPLDDNEIHLALEDCNKAIRLDPELAFAYFVRAECFGFKGQYDASINDATEAILLNPKDGRPYAARAASWKLKGNNAKANADFREAERLFKLEDQRNP